VAFAISLADIGGFSLSALWGALRHQVLIPLALPTVLVLLALVLRLGRALWFRLKQGGFPPIVVRAADDVKSRGFAAQLSEYLTQDAPGPAVIIPPGSGAPPPPVPVEQLGSPGGWVAAFTRIVLSREPAFDVYVECPKRTSISTWSPDHSAIVRATRVPGNRVLAANRLNGTHESRVVDDAGCLIMHSVRRQPGILRHTPRWEHWSPEIKGYAAYRRALDYERRGDQETALEQYEQALGHEPGNFLISIRKAALLEVMGNFKGASEVYRTCNELWPEHIETAYRLAASYANAGDHELGENVLKGIRKRLRPRALRKELRKSWLLTHWNVGERRYWRSWFSRQPPIFGASSRHLFLKAVRVAEQVRGIGRIVSTQVEVRQTAEGAKRSRKKVGKLLKKMANITTRRSIARAHIRLFHPTLPIWKHWKCKHVGSWHDRSDDQARVIYPGTLYRLPRLLRPRKRIGWLAHYNAACFYSLALDLEENLLPPGFTVQDWKMDCARAAIRELGHVRRDPLSRIEPEWYRNDPELCLLRNFFKGTRWAEFVGL
jgi:tetratricopeptide (TPR) repeat protein